MDRKALSQVRGEDGLCGSCLHAESKTSEKGSTFILCGLSRTDPGFPRFPRLPVLVCPGHSPLGKGCATDFPGRSKAINSAKTSDDFAVLVRLIVEADEKNATRMVMSIPNLAGRTSEDGATRGKFKPFFFKAIMHYMVEGDTALHMAAAGYRLKIAKLLIAKGADVRARNRRGAEPLHYAADGGPGFPHWSPKAQPSVIGILVKAGADPDALDKSGVGPLHRAVRTRCASAVQALLRAGADPDLKNKNGSTPLQLASRPTGRGGSGSLPAKEEQKKILQLLLRAT